MYRRTASMPRRQALTIPRRRCTQSKIVPFVPNLRCPHRAASTQRIDVPRTSENPDEGASRPGPLEAYDGVSEALEFAVARPAFGGRCVDEDHPSRLIFPFDVADRFNCFVRRSGISMLSIVTTTSWHEGGGPEPLQTAGMRPSGAECLAYDLRPRGFRHRDASAIRQAACGRRTSGSSPCSAECRRCVRPLRPTSHDSRRG